MDLFELRDQIKAIDIHYPLEEPYTELWNTMADYWNESQDSLAEYLFDDYIDDECVEQFIRGIIDDDGLYRLYYFLGDADLRDCLFKIDCYGNLTNIDTTDLEDLKSEIIDEINDRIEEVA